ncbi:hypothetical protein FHS27_003652 [Rhodopirellula rubra]|uniref:DUF2007 domain-containing protein n=2 Tax=Aporhodopirellula rubra TaxID=980271 RepID=A0A7W5E0F2_9BACT|nr:hypothetical protein [Aporhodopirellula rubra]
MMENKPSESSAQPQPPTPSPDANIPTLTDPVMVYNANGNLEAHSVVTWLESNNIDAYAVEDNSGAGAFAFGTMSQIHKPQVFVERTDAQRATELLAEFETQKKRRLSDIADADPIASQCEECGTVSEFPASQDGTTQSCPKCHVFMDVGTFDWPEDFDFGEPEPELTQAAMPDNEDDALDAAAKLDETGEWDSAINAYHQIAERWPEHSTYTQNCIADIERKRDLGSASS